MSIRLLTFATLVVCSSALHAIPDAMPVGKRFGSGNWSATPDGMSFTVTPGEDGAGMLYRAAQSTSQPIAPVEHASKVNEPKLDEDVMLNSDGRVLINFRGSELVIRDTDTGAEVWRGVLPGLPRPYGATSVHYRTSDRRLQLLDHNRLFAFTLGEDGTASPLSQAEVSFVNPGRSVFGNFVQSGAFTSDGQTLFLGTMDGEVLKVGTGQKEPQLLGRLRAFQVYRPSGFSDDADGYVSRLRCSEGCRYLLLGSHRQHQIGIVDTESAKLRGHLAREGQYEIAGIGGGLFVLSRREGRRAEAEVVDADLGYVGALPELSGAHLVFGFKGGVAALFFGTDRTGLKLTFYDVWAKVAEQHRREAEERQRAAALERQLPDYWRRLKSGDDSHCGLVVDRKADIALIETPIGQKWLKVRQLYPAGSRNCTFVNGVLRD